LAIRPALIDSVGAVPEPVKLPSGQESFTLTIQVGVQYYRFCYGTVAARDAAMAQVLKALEG
jgi:hypothetical protein